jgi:hypothetical protein
MNVKLTKLQLQNYNYNYNYKITKNLQNSNYKITKNVNLSVAFWYAESVSRLARWVCEKIAQM